MTPLRLLLLAAALHVAATITVFLIGHFQLLPGFFDTNGIGTTFAIDGATYQRLASQMATYWQSYGIGTWLDIQAPLHCRLYSIPFAIFGWLVGHNVIAAEPLNLFYYLGTLTIVFRLGREIFDERAGLGAAAIVAVWPSFLAHSTQLIRDPLAVMCFLALLLVLTLLLTRDFPWKHALALGIAGAVIVTVFWVARGNMWNALFVAVAIAVALLVFRMIRERKFMPGNAIVMLMMIVTMLLAPSRFESTTLAGVRPPNTPLAIRTSSQAAPEDSVWTSALKQITQRRRGFRFYGAQESNIAADVQLNSFSDVVRFLPRATAIGFFAPFPRMWFQSGSYGMGGRLISGAETFVMYFVYLLVAVCLWRERRRLTMWLAFLTAATGLIGLGLVVINAGALYRLRYVFWIIMIVIAAQEIVHLTMRRTSAMKS